jgi:S1/P1 Nuclease
MKKNSNPLTEFSAPRHKSIAELADGFLTAKAKTAVKKLLAKVNVTTLKEIATWADDIKPVSQNKPTDKETQDFLKKFPDTREWHFVDLPVDAAAYDVSIYAAFTREDDIVHTIVECINILTGNSNKFSKPNALRWLVHLTGDIHQPLHIACSYVDYNKPKPQLVFKKDEILSRNLLQKSDRGGNKINLPIGTRGKALHSYWDADLPLMDNDFTDAAYTPPPAVALNKLTGLPAQWVGENVQFAKEAYKGLTVTGKNATHATYIDVSWDKAAYNKRCIPIVKKISLKAANRLAFLLNTIYG